MDPHNLLNKNLQAERPIILSPPPLDPQPSLHGNQQLPFSQERQHSVGYYLQHEFETLKADLDLDLKERETDLEPNLNESTSAGLGGSLLGSSTSKYGFTNDIVNPSLSSSSLLRDNNMSKNVGTHTMSNGINSLLSLSQSNNLLPPHLASAQPRPQSVNDFSNFFGTQSQTPHLQTLQNQQAHQSIFYQDLLIFSNWIENLSPQDNLAMIDHLCNNLPLDILLAFKSKLDIHLTNSHMLQKQQPGFGALSPLQHSQQQDLFNDMDNLTLNDNGRNGMMQHHLHQPKPKPNSFKSSHYLFADQKNQRPKSADPSLNNRFNGNPQNAFERSRSPTSHLFEKTNFLQLAAANSNSPSLHTQQGGKSDDPSDLSAHAALKLGALATINSRVALDSNRKNYGHYGTAHVPQQQTVTNRFGNVPNVLAEESINRAGNSASVPVSIQRNNTNSSVKTTSSNGKNKKNDKYETLDSSIQSHSGTPQPTSNSSMPSDISNPELLNNIPAWLKLLRLHKYTECLKDLPWKDLIELNDEQLEEKGVRALGARRKLLKAFDVVKQNT